LPQPEHGALVFHAEDVDDLAAKLSAILSDPSSEERAAAGKTFAAREFGSEKIAKQAEEIYMDVLRHANRVTS
jgi:glycosyltransferase involved in cell wall biosynthesis